MPWKEVHAEVGYRDAWIAEFGEDGPPPPRVYRRGPLQALVGREPVAKDDLRWHISISGDGRIPTWEELVQAAHELRPGVCFVVGIPPRSWWINVHPHVLHLHEIRDEALETTWREQRRGDRAS